MDSQALKALVRAQFPGVPVMRILRCMDLPLPPKPKAPGLAPCESPDRRLQALSEVPLDLSLIGIEIPGWTQTKVELGLIPAPKGMEDRAPKPKTVSLRTHIEILNEQIAQAKRELAMRHA
jgi:hypothetical protein